MIILFIKYVIRRILGEHKCSYRIALRNMDTKTASEDLKLFVLDDYCLLSDILISNFIYALKAPTERTALVHLVKFFWFSMFPISD